MSDRKLEKKVVAGNDAAQVLNNPQYQLALIAVKGDLMLRFENTAWDATDEREEIYRELKALSSIEKKLLKSMKGGQVAAKNIEFFSKNRENPGL